MYETHEITFIQETPPCSTCTEPQVFPLHRLVSTVRVPVCISANRREVVERGGEDAGYIKVGGDADGGGRFGEAVVQVEAVDFAVLAEGVFGAGDDGFLASGVELGEGLGPVGFEGLGETGAEGFAFVFDGELEGAVDEDWGVGAESFVRVASVKEGK